MAQSRFTNFSRYLGANTPTLTGDQADAYLSESAGNYTAPGSLSTLNTQTGNIYDQLSRATPASATTGERALDNSLRGKYPQQAEFGRLMSSPLGGSEVREGDFSNMTLGHYLGMADPNPDQDMSVGGTPGSGVKQTEAAPEPYVPPAQDPSPPLPYQDPTQGGAAPIWNPQEPAQQPGTTFAPGDTNQDGSLDYWEFLAQQRGY